MIERLLLAAPTAALCGVALLGARRRSPLEPSVLLVVTTAIVALFYPLASLFVKPLTWRHGAHLPDEVLLAAQSQFLWFALGVSLVVAELRWRRTDGIGQHAARPRKHEEGEVGYVELRDLVVAGGFVLGGALLYGLYVKQVGLGPLLDRSNFAEKYRVSSGLGSLYIGLNFVIVGCLWAEASSLSRRWTWTFRGVAAAVVVWSIAFVAVRTYAVALFLGYVYLACRRTNFTLSRVRPSLVLVLCLGYVSVEAYAMLRGAWRGSLIDAMQTLQREQKGMERTLGQVVGGSELSHPFLTMMELAQYEEAGALRGESYAGAALGVLPLWVHPNRPPTPAQEFVRRHYPSFEARGGGTAFSIVGEAWWNFGPLLGPLLIGFGIARMLLHMERTAAATPTSLITRFQPYLVHMILLLHRGSSVTVTKHLFAILVPVALLVFTSRLIWNAAGHRANHRSLTVPPAPRATSNQTAPLTPTLDVQGGV